ncbi:NACHT domain-containing protein [Streptomyces chengbuensis]|uniref:NACHT domain-containing protein n=1 Tax=Streptomyces TaxID=1883 RepID=UPI0025B61057|nr:NACHT domain-containing protein [Streptomyces sp. HUAS CB01]WJY51819.1 NACHT domain-containing protein [Streptomyces sp. HUAS CB01]
MEPALIGSRLASAALSPLVRRLLVQEGVGAALTDRPVRLAGLVSFRGEKRTLTERDVHKLAGTLVRESLARPGEAPFPGDEAEAVADALARTLLALGELEMDDVQAVRHGHRELARRLRTTPAARRAAAGLSADATLYLDSITEWACLHILQFFTQRSSFVARTLVEQSRTQAELIRKLDELIRRVPRADARDTEFERRYLQYVARRHGDLTIYGIDLHDSPDEWPLDVAYLCLDASARTAPAPDPRTGPAPATDPTGPDLEPGPAADRQEPPGDGVRWPGRARGADDPEAEPVPADQALAAHDRVLLRGVAGSGKTTLVQWLAVSATRVPGEDPDERMSYLHDRVPFVLPLRTLTRHGERLPAPEGFLSAVGCPLTPPEDWADRVLTAGRGLILVDGVDEVPEAERSRTRRWLRDLLGAYGAGNRWLVTSRPSAVRDDWLAADGFTDLTLSPMSRRAVTTFVQRWHRAAGADARTYEQPLQDALRSKQDLAALATNPLMCGLICALHRDRRGFLPRGRKALYEAALAMLLTRRDRERDMGAPSGVDLAEAPQIQLVQRLAYWMTLNGRTQMDRSRAESLVLGAIPAVPEAAAAGDPQAVFAHLLHRSGLLRESSPGAVDFVHRTFQDHLAAKAIVDEWHIGVLVRHAADDQWEDVIRMSVAHARPRECAEIFTELLAAADAAPDRAAQLRILVVAAAAMEQATEIAPSVREALLSRTAEAIPPRTVQEARALSAAGPLVLDLLPGPEEAGGDDVAHMTVVTASLVDSDAAVPFLARYAGHPSVRVRSQLVWSWDRYDHAEYARDVIAAIDPSGLYFTVRNGEQARSLAALGGGRAVHFQGDLPEELIAATVRSCAPPAVRISRNPRLTGLDCLTDAPVPPRDVEIDRCPALTDLSAVGPLTTLLLDDSQLAVVARVPDVEGVQVELRRAEPTLRRVPELFPGLPFLSVVHLWQDEPVDLSPLTAVDGLRRILVVGDPALVLGADGFPGHVSVTVRMPE